MQLFPAQDRHANPCRLNLLLIQVLILVLVCGCQPSGPADADRPNVLLVTLDTLRADRIGAYGKTGAGTPTLDALAARGALFEQALSSSPITTPAHSTIFTGTYPPYHGVRDNGLFVLPESQLTLAEILRDAGYRTAAFVGSFPTTSRFGLAQGFEHFDEDINRAYERFDGLQVEHNETTFFDERNSALVNDRFLPWLRSNHDRPFFAWLHYWDPHHPHTPPEPFASQFAHDRYQGEIAHADASLGVVLRELAALGIADDTLVVVIADHGEGLGQHNEATHSLLAYNATLHVPFIIAGPGVPATRVAEIVGSVDLLPTVLSLLSLPVPDHVTGTDLMPVVDGAPWADRDRSYYAETLSPRLSQGWGELRVVVENGLKYIHGPRPELFDLKQDFHEWDDLIDARPEAAGAMHDRLEELLGLIADPGSAQAVQQADQATLDRLAGLGYINRDPGAAPTLSETLSTDGSPPQDMVHLISLTSRIRQAFVSGSYLTAKSLAEQMLVDDPTNGNARGVRAYSFAALGRTAEALEAVRHSMPYLVPSSMPYFLEVLTRGFRDPELRLESLELCREMHALLATADSAYLLAEMFHELGDMASYRKHLEQSLELDSAHARSRLSLAILDAEDGNLDGATGHLEMLLEAYPYQARYHYNYAVVLDMAGRSTEALDHLTQATTLDPVYRPPQKLKATLQERLGVAP